MNDQQQLVEEHLGLAKVIAFEYANIPRTILDDVIAHANTALIRAAAQFDPKRGEFAPYAAKAIRNALNSLYTSELRYAKAHQLSLDQTTQAAGGQTTQGQPEEKISDSAQDVVLAVRARESKEVLARLISALPKRSRVVVERIRDGRSYQEIGEELGMSKQAAHKIAQATLQSLLERLQESGFSGLDSWGFLKTAGTQRRQE